MIHTRRRDIYDNSNAVVSMIVHPHCEIWGGSPAAKEKDIRHSPTHPQHTHTRPLKEMREMGAWSRKKRRLAERQVRLSRPSTLLLPSHSHAYEQYATISVCERSRWSIFAPPARVFLGLQRDGFGDNLSRLISTRTTSETHHKYETDAPSFPCCRTCGRTSCASPHPSWCLGSSNNEPDPSVTGPFLSLPQNHARARNQPARYLSTTHRTHTHTHTHTHTSCRARVRARTTKRRRRRERREGTNANVRSPPSLSLPLSPSLPLSVSPLPCAPDEFLLLYENNHLVLFIQTLRP